MNLAERYQLERNTPSDIVEHLPTFVRWCRDLNAQTVIELGVRRGSSTTAWLYGLEQTGGHLWSVDIDIPDTDLFPHDRWTFHRGDDLDAALVLPFLPDRADIVFIDTSHQYQHTLDELRAYVPRVRPGGVVLLHDTALRWADEYPDHVEYPVLNAMRHYCAIMGMQFTNETNCYGLGTVYVP